MLTRLNHKKIPAGLLAVVLLMQFCLLPSALNMIQYYSSTNSSEVSCNINRCTCDSEGPQFCPMHNGEKSQQSNDQSYVCNCSNGHHTADFTLIDSATPDAIIASTTRGVRAVNTRYALISVQVPSEPFRQVFRPPD